MAEAFFLKHFDLPADVTRIDADTDASNVWGVLVYPRNRRAPLIRAAMARSAEGDVVVSFSPAAPLPYETHAQRTRTERRLAAVAYLGATWAELDRTVQLDLAGPSELVKPEPRIGEVLAEFGFHRPLALTEEQLAQGYTLDSLLPVADAALLMQLLGPTFPAGFSLSDTETGRGSIP
ncbi:MAG TPA: hypothetical protein VLI54_07210 [Bacillota bacterium]|nr:hypothetical protein [Bacillota bacterium]